MRKTLFILILFSISTYIYGLESYQGIYIVDHFSETSTPQFLSINQVSSDKFVIIEAYSKSRHVPNILFGNLVENRLVGNDIRGDKFTLSFISADTLSLVFHLVEPFEIVFSRISDEGSLVEIEDMLSSK